MKLRRFGVVSSPDGGLLAWQRDCLDALHSAGCGRPAWAVAGAGDRLLSRLWRTYLRHAESAPVASPDWWTNAWQNADRTPVDFVVCFSTPGLAIDRPPFGLWRFEVGGGAPIGWRAATTGAPSVLATLRADADRCRVLQQGWLPVSLDYRRAARQLHDVLAGWPARAAAEIEAGGWSALPLGAPPEGTPRDPTDWDLVRTWFVLPGRRLGHWWREAARYDTWNVSVTSLRAPLTDVRQLAAPSADVRWLTPRPPLYYLADPFPYRHNGRDWLLVEEYGHPKGVRGRIARVDPLSSQTDTVTPAIVRDSHLSYPSTFQDGADVLCSPEIHQEDGCVIYRLTDEGTWEPLHHILRGRRIVDPTFFQREGRWWLLFTEYRDRSGNLALHAFHADALAGPWTPHALNPLKSDLASARPAGRPFAIGSHWYRPAQDCSLTYGGAINVMEIETLTPTAFRETLALRLEADPLGPYPDGRHHLVVDDTRVYSDGKRCRYDHLLWWKAWH